MRNAALILLGSLALSGIASAQEQAPPVQAEAREAYRVFTYSEVAIRDFVSTEFSASSLKVDIEPVVAILLRDLAKDGSGGFRIAPQDYDYTLEYRRVGADVQVDKIGK
jgi:hypothetical protein